MSRREPPRIPEESAPVSPHEAGHPAEPQPAVSSAAAAGPGEPTAPAGTAGGGVGLVGKAGITEPLCFSLSKSISIRSGSSRC